MPSARTDPTQLSRALGLSESSKEILMAEFCITRETLDVLCEKYGYSCSVSLGKFNPEALFAPKFYIPKTFYRLDSMQRYPRYRLNVDEVLALELLETAEAKNVFIRGCKDVLNND